MQRAGALAIVLGCGLAGGCFLKEEPDGNPPPVAQGNSAGLSMGGGVASVGGSAGTGGTTTPLTSGGTGADSTGTLPDLGIGVLMIGEIAVGDGAWVPPLPCAIRFYFPEQLDPTTGIASEWEGEAPIVIDEFPYAFMLTRDDFPSTVDAGAEGFVGVRCDFDGDGVMDNVGAFHRGLPAEQVILPADGIEMALQFL